MSAPKKVTATFNLAPKAMIGATGYTSFNLAYTGVPTTAGVTTTILSLDDELTESLTKDLVKCVEFTDCNILKLHYILDKLDIQPQIAASEMALFQPLGICLSFMVRRLALLMSIILPILDYLFTRSGL